MHLVKEVEITVNNIVKTKKTNINVIHHTYNYVSIYYIRVENSYNY